MSQHAAADLAADLRFHPVPLTAGREPKLVAVDTPPPLPADVLAPLGIAPCAPRAAWRREAVERRLLAAADVAVASGVLGGLFSRYGSASGVVAALLGAALVLVVFKLAGMYSNHELRLDQTTLDEAPHLLQLTGLMALLAPVLISMLLSRTLTILGVAVVWAALLTGELLGRGVARRVVRQLITPERCLVIGELAEADRIRDKLASSRARAEVVGSLSLDRDEVDLLDPEVIPNVVRELGINRIILSGVSAATTDATELIRVTRAIGVRVSVLPRMFEVLGSAVAFDDVGGMAMLGVARFGLARSSHLLKRGFDLVVSAAALLVLSPIIAAIGLAIRTDSPGPVFFRQTRVGRRGEHFQMIKFRSMVPDAEARKQDLHALNVAGAGLFKISHDPRVTRLGRLLRSTSLDELPQLINVVRGEMSLVGPRPLVVDEDAQVVGLDRSRLRLTPGMTGPWQLLTDRVPLQEMVDIDYLYATNWSLWLDLKIMLRTVGHVVRRGNV